MRHSLPRNRLDHWPLGLPVAGPISGHIYELRVFVSCLRRLCLASSEPPRDHRCCRFVFHGDESSLSSLALCPEAWRTRAVVALVAALILMPSLAGDVSGSHLSALPLSRRNTRHLETICHRSSHDIPFCPYQRAAARSRPPPHQWCEWWRWYAPASSARPYPSAPWWCACSTNSGTEPAWCMKCALAGSAAPEPPAGLPSAAAAPPPRCSAPCAAFRLCGGATHVGAPGRCQQGSLSPTEAQKKQAGVWRHAELRSARACLKARARALIRSL